MKRDGRKIVGVVAWDTPTAQILERAGVDIVSVGDSVGVNLWGREHEGDVTLEEMLLVCRAVRRGVERATGSNVATERRHQRVIRGQDRDSAGLRGGNEVRSANRRLNRLDG